MSEIPSYLVGIGAQKCATSWVHAVLSAHPDAAIAPEKELNFFSHRYDRGQGWYRRQWPAQARFRAEVSPSYLQDPRVPDRLFAFAPGARIIVCLRDPVARALSQHHHEIVKGHIPPCSFQLAMHENPEYLLQSRYVPAIRRWRRVFGAEAILILLQEEIGQNPADAQARMFKHCGLRPRPDLAPPFRRNVSERPRSSALRTMLRTGGAATRAVGGEGMAALLRVSGPVARLRAWNEQRLEQEIPGPNPAAQRALAGSFAEDMGALARMMGRESLPWPSWQMIGGRTSRPAA